MNEPMHGTTHAEQRIRTLLAEIGPSTHNLGAELVHSDRFRSGEWPRGVYALDRTDMEALLALLDRARTRGDHWKRVAVEMEQDRDRLAARLREARSLRLAQPADAVDPAVHTPERVIAYLRGLGWIREGGADIAELWHHPQDTERRVMLSLHPDAVDYARVTGFLASDVASVLGVGEPQVLADIEAAGDA